MRKGTLILLTAILALCLTCALTGGIAMAYVENYHELEAPIAPMEEGEFSLIVMGDTQCVVEDNPQYLVNTNNWIRDNAQALNLAYVMHMGDMVDDIETTQFESARAAMSILDDAGVPYSLVLGNHDYLGYANSDRNYTMYDSYFPLAATSRCRPSAGAWTEAPWRILTTSLRQAERTTCCWPSAISR